MNCYFVGYSKRSMSYKFYNPNNRYFFETRISHFFEDVEFGEVIRKKNIVFKERYQSPLTSVNNNSEVLIHDIF